jgi:hypothetical protein
VNCEDKSGDRCCGGRIQNQICGTPEAPEAPCTLGTTYINIILIYYTRINALKSNKNKN